MDQLRFTGLHEDGAHLVLTAPDGADFVVPIDDALRAALRRPPLDSARSGRPGTPREVQTLIRAGQTAEEVCDSTGWSVERVQRFEAPIVAERAHVARLARSCVVRTHERGTVPTLESRVRQRLAVRGVDLDQMTWDSTRPDGGGWTVQVTFMAGQRSRQAAWSFDLSARSVEAIDDEARWLSEDEQSLPAGARSAALFGGTAGAPDDLAATMRERSRRRGQSGKAKRKSSVETGSDAAPLTDEPDAAATEMDVGGQTSGAVSADPSAVPGTADIPDDALPLEDLAYDPETMGPPPAAGGGSLQDRAAEGEDDVEPPDAEGVPDYDGRDGDDVTRDELDAADESEADTVREATLADFFGGDELDGDELDGDELGDDDFEGAEGIEEPRADDEAQVAPRVDSPAPEPSAGSKRSRKGRRSVPSWDDIMFGAKDQDR